MRGRRSEGRYGKAEKGTKEEFKEREPKKREPKLEHRGGRLKGQPSKTRLKGKSKEEGALQLWEIQQTLGRGDFIEVSLSKNSIFYSFVQGVLRVSVFRDSPSSSILAPVSLARGTGHLSWRL